MIVYELSCESGHRFEGWFSSSEEFAKQHEDNLLTCPLCGNDKITRVPHTSYVSTGAAPRNQQNDASEEKAKQYANVGTQMLAQLVATIMEKTEDVGSAFPEEARKIHYQEAPERHIRGTATVKEVEALRDEGIEVVALPVPSYRSGKAH